MSFPRYPKYKPSGVEWLGEVPEHWGVAPLCAHAAERRARNDGMQEDNLLSLSYGRIVRKDISSNDGLLPESFETYQIVEAGDTVLRLTDLQNDRRSIRTGVVRERGIITSAYLAIRPVNVDAEYLSLLLRAYDSQKVFYSMGSGLRQSMKYDDLKRLPLLAPQPEEQRAIAAFLDRETAKIDALIAEQEKLIELLAEKRQTVISHAVTKGLNPTAPMKPSGVEWLGDVPAHWETVPLKSLLKSIEQGWSPQCESDPVDPESDWGVLKAGCTNAGMFRPDENKRLPESLKPLPELGLRAGDLLVSRANTRELVGSAAVVPRDFPRLLICDKLYRLRFLADRVDARFVSLYLGSDVARSRIEIAATGASQSMVNVSQAVILELCMPLPPLGEQSRVLTAVAAGTGRIDRLVTEAESGIALLTERRSALISAAVTGQIDVRNAVPETAA